MKRLFILVCAVVISAAGMWAGVGCGAGGIRLGGEEASVESVLEDQLSSAGEVSVEGGPGAAGGQQICLPTGTMPRVITTPVTDKSDPSEGFWCLPSYVPDSADLLIWGGDGTLKLVDFIRDMGKPDDNFLEQLGLIEEGAVSISEFVAFAKFEMATVVVPVKKKEPASEEFEEEGMPEEGVMDEEKMEMTDEEKAAREKQMLLEEKAVVEMKTQPLEQPLNEKRQQPRPVSYGLLLRIRPGFEATEVMGGYIDKLLGEFNRNAGEKDPQWLAKILDDRTVLLTPFKEVSDKVQARIPDQLKLECPIASFGGFTGVPALYAELKGQYLNIFKDKNVDKPEIEKIISLSLDNKAVLGIDLTDGIYYEYFGVVTKDANKPIMFVAFLGDTNEEISKIAMEAFFKEMQQDEQMVEEKMEELK